MNLEGSLLLFAVIGVPIVWLVVTYNRFIDLRQHIKSAWAGIDVELKRRHDLIPQLVSVVRGYAEYESQTFKSLVEARNAAITGMSTPAKAAAAESGLMRELQRFFVQVEAYPQLRANGQYASLQRELAETEDRIAAARRLYNGNVRDWRSLRDGFPSLVVGKAFGMAAENHEFFELASDAERVVPRVAV
jgi:LemA protein